MIIEYFHSIVKYYQFLFLFLESSLRHYVLQKMMNILFTDLKPYAYQGIIASYPVLGHSSYAPLII